MDSSCKIIHFNSEAASATAPNWQRSSAQDVDVHNEKDVCLFTDDAGNGLSFILLRTDFDDFKKYERLITDRWGVVKKRLKEFGDHDAVLVPDHKLIHSHTGVVFKLSYVKDCVDQGELLNISDYRKDEPSEYIDDFNYMDIIYKKRFTWTSVPPKYLKPKEAPKEPRSEEDRLLEDDDDIEIPSTSEKVSLRSSMISRKPKGSSIGQQPGKDSLPEIDGDIENPSTSTKSSPGSKMKREPAEAPNRRITEEDRLLVDRTNIEKPATKSQQTQRSMIKRSKSFFTSQERRAIIDYIFNSKDFDQLKGNLFWKRMEKDNVCPIRTWQSMKNHFIRTLAFEVHRFPVSKEDLDTFHKMYFPGGRCSEKCKR